MAITQSQLIEVAQLLQHASNAQLEVIVSSLTLSRTSIQSMLSISPPEMQEVLNSLGAKAAEVPFLDVFKAYLKFKLAKGASSQEKKKFGFGAEDQQEAQQLMLKVQNQMAKISLAKSQEEVLKLRIGNKQASEEYVSIEILTPILSQGLGNIANQLRAMGMFNPELIGPINECIQEIKKTGFALVEEAKNETEKYLNEFRVSEEDWNRMILELEVLQREIDNSSALLESPALNSFGSGELL